MLKIGLTGGIGSGKTTVAKIFELLAVPVFYADLEAKKLMNEDEKTKHLIILHFGEESYKDGLINRPFLAESVFSDPEKTKLINSIIHPATVAKADEWMMQQKRPYALKEAALIFEAGAEKNLDLIIGVFAPYQLRLRRSMQRDNLAEAAVLARMNKQMDEDEKLSKCDFVINNNDTELLIPQVIALHGKLLLNIERLHN